MKLIMNLFTLSFMLAAIMMLLCSIISKKTTFEREKMTPFECGFDPKSSARTPFSIRFFLIAVIFLIFDVEIALLVPFLVTFNSSNPLTWSFTAFFFIIILLIGLFYEWKEGSLSWKE
uniref:NADH-ubiquinone oxidoreductase chain 3 n=1 Tax=Mirhipipteryx andensis TaxID=1564103 RepID=A0A0N7AS43_9ORTH|nr:NADH dehydrogenase subunit 3 [Mirhipipteryx andensis]AJW76426.1 NADH dehydrogenase subunit 3 [Mirhipipteryx andensis]